MNGNFQNKTKMSRDSILEIQHKREQSHDSGTYQDWTLEESYTPSAGQQPKNADFVTVVAVDEKPFVTVLSVDSSPPDSEEVLVYRLPGERLGFGLKFDGGVKSAEKVKKLLIQSCAEDSPASRTRASWGPLSPGDEILVIDSVPVSEMTRMDCVRALKESNVVIKLRVRQGGGAVKEEDKEAPPIPPRKFPRKKELLAEPPAPASDEQKHSPPVLPRCRQAPQAEIYTDLLAQDNMMPNESESDDTGSSISTVVSRISSTPTTCNSSFSDARSINSADFPSPQPGKPSAYDLDKVLEPFLHLEREFSSAGMNENNIYHKLAEATNLLEEAPKPAPRQERRRPPPPPPPPRVHPETRHLPRLIDFVPKDRTDVLVPSPLLPSKPAEDVQPKEDMKEQIKEAPDRTADTKKSMMDVTECNLKQNNSCRQDKFSPTFSRLPPDGHEFPIPQDKILLVRTDAKCTTSSIKELKPKSNFDSKKISSETCKYSWRNDEKSEKSVKDKIAMFSCAQNSTVQVPKCIKKTTSAKLLGQEIIDSSLNENEIKDKIDNPKPMSSIKKGSLPYQSLFDVSGNFDPYKNSLPKSEKTQSTLDLTENSLSNNCMAFKSEFCTLPRKSDQPKHSLDNKCYMASTGNTTLTRALSFSGESKLHTRSQSLIDVGSKNPSFLKNNDELRRSSLAALAEHRKKGFSKLRGLVIPEKLVEIPNAQVVDDLPVIKSNDCLIADNIEEDKSTIIKNEIDKLYNNNNINNNKPPIDKSASLMTTPIWKSENNGEIPKYSPAFKRKSLSLYGTSSSVSSVSSSLSSSREELRICFNDTSKTLTGANTNITRSLANLSRNPFSSHSEPKSLESITSPSISDVSYEYSQESISPNLNACNDVLSRFKYNEGYNSDTQRSKGEERGLEEESDNDSAVSSSRSSISPPHSPMPSGKKNDSMTPPLKNTNRYDLKLKRTLSSETTASNSSSGSTLTSGSQASCSSSGSCTSTENKRILKAQSVEAINRKNVLSSARYSSGTDSKAEMPSLDDKCDSKQTENGSDQQNSTLSEDIVISQKNNELYSEQINTTNETNATSVNGDESEFSTFHSKLENSPIKSHDQCNELIKCETSFNIDDFTYSSHKGVDKNSNMKINDYNDFPDGIIRNENQNKWPIIENNTSEYLPPCKLNRPILQVESKYEKQKDDSLPSPKSINVNSMKKVFEKGENLYLSNPRFKMNLTSQISIQHPRVSSVDSTNSDDSCVPNPSHYGSVSNLQKETQFGSITSLASSTSLISQQELSQLIEEANHTLEDEGNTHEVVVVILHRDIPGGSIGITLAGGADYEAKEITVHKVLIGSPAERDGRIQKGDRILSINGKSMKGLTHYESLAILKAPRPEVVLVVSRHKGDVPEDQNSSTVTLKSSTSVRLNKFSESKALNQTKGKDAKWGPPIAVTLIKDGAGLGFSLEGGKDSPYGDQPLTIKKIFTGGCAEKCGNLFAGDELLSVNNIDVSELSRIEAWSLMKRLPDGEVLLNVRRQFS